MNGFTPEQREALVTLADERIEDDKTYWHRCRATEQKLWSVQNKQSLRGAFGEFIRE